MLVNGSRLVGCPVLSLHVGGAIAEVAEPIIDPNNLKVIAFRVTGPLVTEDLLPVDSVREFSPMGMVIDSADDLVDGEEVVRLKKILALKFALNGLKVVTKKKVKLGKVSDYVANSASWDIHQLIVQRPALKALLDPELTIARTAIVEVTDYEVIVKDEHETVKKKAATPAGFTPDFVNPFRKPDFAAGTSARRP